MAKSILIGIAGGSGSGKTLVAQKLVQYLGDHRVLLIQQDSYYKDLSHISLEEREQRNFDHPDSIDEDLLVEHLTMLLRGEAVEQPIYDFALHTRSKEMRHIAAPPVIVLDGILVLHSAKLRDLMAIKIFVDTADDIRLLRRIRRDVKERGRDIESVITQYETSVRPMHLKYVESSKKYADIIIPRGGLNEIAIDIIRAKIEQLVSNEPQSSRSSQC
ncbi:uridine kinase [candidate division KSB1 bacterium]|nr:uridine kinase [candidate division KSB1 bacterium]